MEFRVLGTLDVADNGRPLSLGSHKRRSLLALLLIEHGRVVSTDRMIDELWGDEAGPDRQNTLWVHISNLRSELEPDRARRSEGTLILTRAPGYVLAIEPDQIDAVRFDRLVSEGRAAIDHDPAAASTLLSEALELWRGHAYEEFTYEAFAQTEIARLDELRLEAVGARIEADLVRGLSGELVSELETLIRQHPLRERFAGQLMLAQYRVGRRADALRAYQALRTRLAEEVGVDPSPELRELEARILSDDPGIAAPSTTITSIDTRRGLAVRGYELRAELGRSGIGTVHRAYQPAVGREVAITAIPSELADDPAFIRRFEAEARLVAGLEHPHIVPIYDYWREPGAAYLVTRLMSGGSVADVMASSALTEAAAGRLVDDLAPALAAGHAHGVVHGDIRPENILFDDSGAAYLSGFGIRPPHDGAEPASSADDVRALALVVAQGMTGLVGRFEQLEGALPGPVAEALRPAITPPPAERIGLSALRSAVLRATGGGEPRPTPVPSVPAENPYRGLEAFDAADAGVFHGRQRVIERLVARLGLPGATGRFVAVVGPSGSGKSSVVRAGLLPALAKDAVIGSSQWFVTTMTPGPHPFEAMEEALLRVAIDPPPTLYEQLTGGQHGLRRAARRILPDDRTQLLVMIDQFEELFTLAPPDLADAFLDALAAAVADDHGRVRVVVTIRADFYDRPLRHLGFGELLREGTEVITPMSPEELEEAITEPVRPMGIAYAPALVAEIVREVAGRPGALPLLQYTLTELFEARRGIEIPPAAYRDLGGVSGALVTRAESLTRDLGPTGEEATRQIFLRLVTLGEGSDDTRRRVLRSELEQLTVDRTMVAAVLETFGRHRLLSFDRDPVTRGPTVEISHEALLTEWGRLRSWIDDARHDVRNQRRLAIAMGDWIAAERTDDYLLHGGQLDELAAWAGAATTPLSAPEQAYLDASAAARDRAEAEARERETRADEAERSARRRSRQLAGAGLVALVVGALAVFGFVQWRSAADARDDAEAAREESERLVTAEELRAASDGALTTDPELALLLAVDAVRATADLGFATEEAVDSLHWALQRRGVQYPVGASARTTVRSGPTGLTGVFLLPPADLVVLAEASTERRLTDDECRAATGADCLPPTPVDPDLPLRFGDENYGVDVPEVLPGVPAYGDGPLAGTRVTLAAVGSVAFSDGLRAELDRFTDTTGIQVDVLSNLDFDLTASLSTGQIDSFPDIAGLFQPPPSWARARAIDLTGFLEEETLRSDFGDYLIDLSTFDGSGKSELLALPMNLHPKSVVYYPKRAFDAAGYEVPETWDELVSLSEQMVRDGHRPWCFQWEAGFASGFPGSDFLEGLIVRSAGVDAYDDWVAGDLSFASPEIIGAAHLGEEILFGSGFVRGGPESISQEHWGSVALRLLDLDPLSGEHGPQCFLVHQVTQMIDLLGPDTEIGPGGVLGEDVDFFILPPLVEREPAPITGSGLMATAMADRPEVRELMRHIASPRWGEVWAGVSGPGDTFLSVNRRFDTSTYAGIVGPETGRSRQRVQADTDARGELHQLQRAAIEAGTWRYDASDLMPSTFAAWTEDFVPGPFWQGMLDWVDRAAPIEQILADIEAARPPPDS